MHRLKITDTDFHILRDYVFSAFPKEAGVFALAGIHSRPNGIDILVRRPIEVPPGLFKIQCEEHLEISTQAINGLASLCEANQLGAVICHSHPEDIPYSPSDNYGERRLFEYLTSVLPKGIPLASLLFCPDRVRGRIWIPYRHDFEQINKIIVIGRSMQVYTDEPADKLADSDANLYDRQVLAFGVQGQVVFSKAKVAVIGVGGIGSSTAEQLVRLGVKDLVLVDHDIFAPSNLTRMYGTFSPQKSILKRFSRRKSDSKVSLIASHLRHIKPDVKIRCIPQKVVLSQATKFLLDRDVIFLCTDDHWGRSIVNQIAYQYLIPVINVGMSICSQNGTITSAFGAVDIIRPGTACLWCSQFLNSARIAAESTPREKRKNLYKENYVEEVDTHAPSVVSVTTTLAGMAVTQFLQMMTDFMGNSGSISRLRYDIMQGTVRRGVTNVMKGCVCQKNKSYGDLRLLQTVENLPAGV